MMESKQGERSKKYEAMLTIASGTSDSLECLRGIFEQRKRAARIWMETTSAKDGKDAADMVNYCNQQIKIALGIIDL